MKLIFLSFIVYLACAFSFYTSIELLIEGEMVFSIIFCILFLIEKIMLFYFVRNWKYVAYDIFFCGFLLDKIDDDNEYEIFLFAAKLVP